MKRNGRGLGVYILIFIVIMLVMYSFDARGLSIDNCTYTEFEQSLEDGKVKEIVIKQNREVPTGVVNIALNDGGKKQLNVSDVKDVEQTLEKYHFTNYSLKDVPRENILVSILPTILTAVSSEKLEAVAAVLRKEESADEETEKNPAD